ncbi:hypothetical protein C8J56DRAFT_1063497 [Mycena floridula]|nr:hypothetical protein C8J56DRAFT_1063497 [Mycena floridula]
MTTANDSRRGCTPFIHPVPTAGCEKWYVLAMGPHAGIYQNWVVCDNIKGECQAQKCYSPVEALQTWHDLCDPFALNAVPCEAGITSPGTRRAPPLTRHAAVISGPWCKSQE